MRDQEQDREPTFRSRTCSAVKSGGRSRSRKMGKGNEPASLAPFTISRKPAEGEGNLTLFSELSSGRKWPVHGAAGRSVVPALRDVLERGASFHAIAFEELLDAFVERAASHKPRLAQTLVGDDVIALVRIFADGREVDVEPRNVLLDLQAPILPSTGWRRPGPGCRPGRPCAPHGRWRGACSRPRRAT